MKLLPLVSIALLATVGCNNSGSSKTKTNELTGTWERGCHLDGSSDYISESYQFIGEDEVKYEIVYYSDSACGAKSHEGLVTSTTSIREDRILTTGETVTEINYSVKSVTRTLHDQELVTSYNNQSWCGVANWNIANAVDVTNCNDEPFSKSRQDIYKIDADNIFFGEPGSNGNSRPNVLENSFYTKKK